MRTPMGPFRIRHEARSAMRRHVLAITFLCVVPSTAALSQAIGQTVPLNGTGPRGSPPRQSGPQRRPPAGRPPTGEPPTGAPVTTLPAGWFGFGIRCDECGYVPSTSGTGAATPQWEFQTPPVVINVEPGSPAALAGMQAGDSLTQIDGSPLNSLPGGTRFGAVVPGQKVRWTFRRDGTERNAVILAVMRPDQASRQASPGHESQPRFHGDFGNIIVDVEGAPITASLDPQTGELVIRSSDTTIRVQRVRAPQTPQKP
jgi:membrane-associated protease RseP (regulator of RpoE activity)